MLSKVQAEGALHCGAVARPGIAEAPPSGGAVGVAVDICRAMAIAAIGPDAKVVFRLYEAESSFGSLRNGQDDVAFLTGNEIAGQRLAGAVLPGPVIAVNTVAVMVPETSPVRHLADLSGQSVCLMVGNIAQRALEAAVDRLHLTITRMAYSEDVEMLDAYNAGRCGAVVGEATYLAVMRLTPGVRGLASRLLPDVLTADPIIAVTGVSDAAWSADVAWIFDALVLADAPSGPWREAGSNSLPVQDPPGLRPDWMKEMIAGTGGYAAIIRRNLTERLGLSAGIDADWPAGLILVPAVQ